MIPVAACVFLVVDEAYGMRLFEIADLGPVWIVESVVNRAATKQWWAEHPEQTHLDGVTIFDGIGASREMLVLTELDVIDLHHDEMSAVQPYGALEVIGAYATPAIVAELSKYGLTLIHQTAGGFRASRS